jgi:hypothetical protein
MEKLPNELILEIFSEIAPHIQYSYIVGSIQDLLCLTMVSKKWRDFILSEPLLWTHLALISNGYDNSAIISVQLHLSNPLPLKIEAYIPFQQWDTLQPMFLQSSDKIETVLTHGFLLHSLHGDPTRATDLWNFLDKLGPLSNLRHLGERWIHPFSIKQFLDRYPSLDQVTGIPLPIQDLQIAKDRLNMESLVTCDDINTVLPIIESIGSLKKVSFLTSGSPPQPRQEDPEAEESGNESISGHQLGWTGLYYRAYDARSLVPLLYRLSSLIHLSIHLDLGISFLDTVAIMVHKLECLEFLSISLDIQYGATIRAPLDLSPNHSARSLRIAIYTVTSREYGSDEREPEEHPHNLSQVIVTTLLNIMPNVTRLDLKLDGSQAFSLSYLARHLSGNDPPLGLNLNMTEKSKKTSGLPSIQRLTLSGNIDVSLPLSSRFVKTLEVSRYYLSTYNELSNPDMRVNLEDWVALEEIHLHGRLAAWNKSSLCFLRKLSIEIDRETEGSLVAYGITGFIKELACRPYSYPSLEDIELNECPEWDILMIMLERRNLLQGPEIKKIRTIKLGSPYSLEIQRIISGLLAGKWTERPSNRDLSLAGNAEILLDLSL